MRRMPWLLSSLPLWAAGPALAADIPIAGLKLIVVDKLAAAGKAKAVFVAKDAAVTKGTGTDPAQIEATLNVGYESASGTFDMPQGSNWLVNSASVAKYVNKLAPSGGAVKVSVIKPTVLVKVVGKSLGDAPLDIATPPSGPVYVVDTIVNEGEETRLCTQFGGCVQKVIAGGTGYKLICKGTGVGDSDCFGADPCVVNRFTDQGATVLDACTNLEWEKKTTVVGSGANAADLHDVDNKYNWAGCCNGDCSSDANLCQPNPAAAATCAAMATGGTLGCSVCGSGTCDVDPSSSGAVTTVWDWVNQLNAANFAGHNDWRLPSELACNSCYPGFPGNCTTCASHELETILLSAYPCAQSPCIASVFGAAQLFYLSSTTVAGDSNSAWNVFFDGNPQTGSVGLSHKATPWWVRAVRGGS